MFARILKKINCLENPSFSRTLSFEAKSNRLEQYKKEGTIYYHWPFCKNICIYCSFNKYATSNKRFQGDLVNKLSNSFLTETEHLLDLSGLLRVKSIYFGGGTPSLAPVKTISSLIKFVKDHTELDNTAEVSIECNPSSDIKYHLEKYAEIGINRVSIGLQVFC